MVGSNLELRWWCVFKGMWKIVSCGGLVQEWPTPKSREQNIKKNITNI